MPFLTIDLLQARSKNLNYTRVGIGDRDIGQRTAYDVSGATLLVCSDFGVNLGDGPNVARSITLGRVVRDLDVVFC